MTTYGPCAADAYCLAHNGDAAEDADRHALGPACLRAAELAVRALPADWRDLEQLLPPALGVWGDGQPHGRGAPPSIPLNTGVEALQAAIWWTVTAWEEVAREMHRLADPPWRRPGPPVRRFVVSGIGQAALRHVDGRVEHPTAAARPMRPGPADVVRAAAVLAPRLGPLSDLPARTLQDYPLAAPGEGEQIGASTYVERAGWQGVLDLHALHQRAMAVLGLTAPARRLPGTCPACERDELRQDQPRSRGDEQAVYCRNCALTMTYEDYRQQMGAWAA